MRIATIWVQYLVITLLLVLEIGGAVRADSKKYRMAVTDITGMEELQREFKDFQAAIQEHSTLDVKLFPVTSRTAVVESLRKGRLDFALTGPGEYIIVRSRTKVTPVVGFLRPGYKAAVIARADSGIENLASLRGKRMGLGDVGSTSYYLAPLFILNQAGITPDDIEKVSLSKQVAWRALKRGEVAAVGMNHGRFEEFRAKESDPTQFKILGLSPQLPDDVLIAGSHVEASTIDQLRSAFATQSDALVAALLKGTRNNKYDGMRFTTNVDDSDYDLVRQMYANAGHEHLIEERG